MKKRKHLLEISEQPELWIFSNILTQKWFEDEDVLKDPIFYKKISTPIALPQGFALFKIETDGIEGKIISLSIGFESNIHLFLLTDPKKYDIFKEKCLEFIKNDIIPETFTYFSYLKSFYIKKLREFGLFSILQPTDTIKDLADYGVKSRILQRISDPIEGYEVPQFWNVNCKLSSIEKKELDSKEKGVLNKIRIKIIENLGKHAVIECTRLNILFYKHYSELLNNLTSESRLDYSLEYSNMAKSLLTIGDFQNAALFFSKALSDKNLSDSTSEKLMESLNLCVDRLKPHEIIEYALFASKIAKSYNKEI